MKKVQDGLASATSSQEAADTMEANLKKHRELHQKAKALIKKINKQLLEEMAKIASGRDEKGTGDAESTEMTTRKCRKRSLDRCCALLERKGLELLVVVTCEGETRLVE